MRREGRNADHNRTESSTKDSKHSNSKMNEDYYHQVQKLLKPIPIRDSRNALEKDLHRKGEENPAKLALYSTQKLCFKNPSPDHKKDNNEPMMSYMDTTVQIKPKSKKQYYNERTINDSIEKGKGKEDSNSLFSTDSLRNSKPLPKMHLRNLTTESTNRDVKNLAYTQITKVKQINQGNEKSRSNAHALQMSDYFRGLINQKVGNSRSIKGKSRHRNNFSNVLSSSTLQGSHGKKVPNLM